MATVLFLGGIFNIVDPILGLQLYIWSWLLLVIVAIFAWLGFYFGGWKPYAPLHGLYYAWKAGSNAAFIFDANLIGEMVSERMAKCIFDYSKEEYVYSNFLERWLGYYPTAYLANITPLQAIVYKFGGVNKDVEIARHLQGGEWERSPSVVCGGVPVDIVVDTDNWTIRDSPQHKAIETCARMWNEINPNDRIESYSKFQKALTDGNIVCPSVKSDSLVTWTRIDNGFSLNQEESDYAGKKRQMAEFEYDKDTVAMNRLAVWVLVGCLAFAALVFLVRVGTHLLK
jgi:hypothetical protein